MERDSLIEEKNRPAPICGDEKCPIGLEHASILCSAGYCGKCLDDRKQYELHKRQENR